MLWIAVSENILPELARFSQYRVFSGLDFREKSSVNPLNSSLLSKSCVCLHLSRWPVKLYDLLLLLQV